MICFQDRTFCDFYKECEKGEKCSRALTHRIANAAKKAHMPIAQFENAPSCFKLEEDEDEGS